MLFDLTQSLGVWTYFLLAILVMFEGPIATLVGAAAAASGLMKPVGVFLSASAGNLIADCLWFGLGYLGKTEWLVRYGKWLGVKQEQVTRLEKDVFNHAPKLLFLAKLTLGFSVPTLIATGLARVPLKRWFGFLILAETLWTGTLVILGYYFGRYLQTLEWGIQIVTLAGTVIFSAVILFYIARFRRKLDENQ